MLSIRLSTPRGTLGSKLGRGRGPASGSDFALLRRLVRKEKENRELRPTSVFSAPVPLPSGCSKILEGDGVSKLPHRGNAVLPRRPRLILQKVGRSRLQHD